MILFLKVFSIIEFIVVYHVFILCMYYVVSVQNMLIKYGKSSQFYSELDAHTRNINFEFLSFESSLKDWQQVGGT